MIDLKNHMMHMALIIDRNIDEIAWNWAIIIGNYKTHKIYNEKIETAIIENNKACLKFYTQILRGNSSLNQSLNQSFEENAVAISDYIFYSLLVNEAIKPYVSHIDELSMNEKRELEEKLILCQKALKEEILKIYTEQIEERLMKISHKNTLPNYGEKEEVFVKKKIQLGKEIRENLAQIENIIK